MRSFAPESDSEDELGSEWAERVTKSGNVYYVNHNTKCNQFSHPRTGKTKKVVGELPYGWIKELSEDGKILFVNHETNRSTFTDPRLAFAIEENNDRIRQRFDGGTRALQVLHGIDLSGKVAIITGANSGIGFETARSLAYHGCEVIFACRDSVKALEAIEQLEMEKPGRKCHFMKLCLNTLRDTQLFTEQVKEKFKHIDYLILNAAVFAIPYTLTNDNIETIFQVCHLSHFYLTLELSDLLSHSRIIIVSSESHRFSNLPVDLTPQNLSPPPGKFSSMSAYNNAKLCNILFARELAKRWHHRNISVFCLHPGNMISSNLSRHFWLYRLFFAVVRPFTKSLQQGASTTVYCATATELAGLTGLYFNNCYLCEPSKMSQKDSMSTKLWDVSKSMVSNILESNKRC